MKAKDNKFYHEQRIVNRRFDDTPRTGTNTEYQIKSSWRTEGTSSWLIIFLFSLFIFLFLSCSSAPQPTGNIFVDRNVAVQQLNLANQTASRGRYNDALLMLGEARRLAVSSDDPYLRLGLQ